MTDYDTALIAPPMTVQILAVTRLVDIPDVARDTAFGDRLMHGDDEVNGTDIDLLAEIAGRACYQAWDMPSQNTATNEGYLANIVKQQHFSVVEHGSVTAYVRGVSRSLTHQFERHRHFSYSELSQRYVDMSDVMAVVPPLFRESPEAIKIIADNLAHSKKAYADLAAIGDALITEQGETRRREARKKVREAARVALPDVETHLVLTGNIRAMRDMLTKRYSEHADKQIQGLAAAILDHLRVHAPHSVQDIPEVPYR